MNRQQRRAANRRNRNASSSLFGNPIAEMLGYKEVALSDVPDGRQQELAGYAREMDDAGQGPARFYRKPNGEFTVVSAPQSSR